MPARPKACSSCAEARSGWARTAAQETTGYAASVIGCDAEAGVERILSPEETPDGRPGVSLLLFAFSRDALQKAAVNRVGQCILTCATPACRSGDGLFIYESYTYANDRRAARSLQFPFNPCASGKNRSCHLAGRVLRLPTVAMKSAYFMTFSGEVV